MLKVSNFEGNLLNSMSREHFNEFAASSHVTENGVKSLPLGHSSPSYPRKL